jgi:serine/threonine protein kinase
MMEAFYRAAAKPIGSSGNDFLAAILRERKDLWGKGAYFPPRGGWAHTVVIGDEVFKGPKRDTLYSPDEKIKKFDEEIEYLKSLQETGLPVPRITCEGKGAVFYGMTRVPGIVLGFNVDGRFNESEMRTLAKDIIGFVINMANAMPRNEKGEFIAHDDLHGENILIDPETKRLSGVIDFGLVKYCSRSAWTPHDRFSPDFYRMLDEEFKARKSEIHGSLPAKKPGPPTLFTP